MSNHRFVHALAVVMLSMLCWVPAETQAPAPQPPPADGTSLPVRRVVLYKTGIGYFEHQGRVRGNEDVAIRFTTAQLNDVLKSLTAIDLGRGRIAGVSYNSVAPLSHRLNALRLPLDQHAKLTDLLGTLRGARVEVASAGGVVAGRLLGVEARLEANGSGTTETQYLSLITGAGEVRTFELTPAVRVRLLEADLRQEVAEYLDLIGSTREQDPRRMILQTVGSGERDLRVSYVSEVPVWKSTYRLVIPDENGKALLQGWAIVDNTVGEDWNNVRLSLVAGAPQTFIQEISQPFYTQRPVVPIARNVLLTPQTHQGTLASGPGTLRGTVRDNAGGTLPGVTVRLQGASTLTATTNDNGEYVMTAPAGQYRVEYLLSGFRPVVRDGIVLGGGVERQQDVRMEIGSLTETVNVEAAAPLASTMDAVSRRGRGGVPGGRLGGVVGGLPNAPPPPPPPPAPMEPAAQAVDLGDLFEYRITEPVTIAQNQSALVPIISAPVEVEKVSLWNGSRSGRPLRAIWLTNSSGLTLDGGSFAVVDGEAFAGEGLIEPLQPGERRLLSYAADLAVLVNAQDGDRASRLMRIRAADGVVTRQTEERSTRVYSLRNEDKAGRVVVIEHPVRTGWKLAAGVTPAESSPSAYRFRVPVEAGQEVAFEVRESRTGESAIHVSNLSDEEILEWRQQGIDAGALERTLKPVLDKKREVEAHENRIAGLQAERETIVRDQERLRENMKALRGSSEERALLRRYTAQLDGQEDRLAELERTIASETRARDKASGEFAALVGALSFEYTTGS